MRILCIIRSQTSYEKIKTLVMVDELEWSENIQGLEELRQALAFQSWDFGIIDTRIPWHDEAILLLERFEIPSVVFTGDFDVVLFELRKMRPDLFPDETPNEEEKEDEGEGHEEVRVQIVEKTRIVEREKQVKVEVPVYSYTSIPSKLSFFLSLTPRAGATVLSSAVACAIGERNIHCSFFEYPFHRVALYDQLNVKLRKPDYIPPIKRIQDGGFLKCDDEFVYQKVTWYMNHPEVEANPSLTDILKMIYQARQAPMVIMDISSCWNHPMAWDLLGEADHIFLVIDPDPVLIERMGPLPPHVKGMVPPEYKLIETLREYKFKQRANIHLIVNKNNEGVNISVLEEVLPLKPLTYIPYFDPASVYRAGWEAKLLYEADPSLDDWVTPILKELLPREYVYRDKPINKPSIFSKMKGYIKSKIMIGKES